jgi:hypothetical protein
MYYYIRVTLKTQDSTDLDAYIQQVKTAAKNRGILPLIKKFDKTQYQQEDGVWVLYAEAWLDNTLTQDRLDIFNKFKTFVTNKGGLVDWHECHNDEGLPCLISEEFKV